MPVVPNVLTILPPQQYDLTKLDTERLAAEASLGMVPPSHPGLSEHATDVDANTIGSQHIRALAERLLAVAHGQKRRDTPGQAKRTLVGLAAPQIGEPLRIVLIDTKIKASRKGPSKLECFINPEIIWRSVEAEEGIEGCFSAGLAWGLVKRPLAVKVRALGLDGRVTERIFEGFTARIACHEIDHLNGIRFADRITNDKKRHWVHTEELFAYRAQPASWPRLCSRERWQTLKSGRV